MYQRIIQNKAERIGIDLTNEEADIVGAYLMMYGINPENRIEEFAMVIQEALDRFMGKFFTKRDFGEWFVENSGYWNTPHEIVNVCVDYESVFDYLYTGGEINYQDKFFFNVNIW